MPEDNKQIIFKKDSYAAQQSILQKLSAARCKKATPDRSITSIKRYGKRLDSIKKSEPSFFSKAYFREFLGAILLVNALFCVSDCRAENVTIAWDASLQTVTGYIVYYGEQSVLANPATATTKDVGNVLQYTIAGLTAGRTYYFAIKAANAYGQSGFSNEIIGTVPAAASTTTFSVATTTIVPSTSTTAPAPSSTTTTAGGTPATTSIISDSDQDGITDRIDNCPGNYNPRQLDADDDGIGDCYDPSQGCGGCGQVACATVCTP